MMQLEFFKLKKVSQICSVVLLLCVGIHCHANTSLEQLVNSLQWPDADQQQYRQLQQELRQTLALLPDSIANHLPGGINILVRDMNKGLQVLPKPVCENVADSSQIRATGKKSLSIGRYNRLTRTLQLDIRLVKKLIDRDNEALPCHHPDWYTLAQAVVLHEIIHSWDWQTATSQQEKAERKRCLQQRRLHRLKRARLTKECRRILNSHSQLSDQTEFLRASLWLKNIFLYNNKNHARHRSVDSYEFANPAEMLAVNLEFFLLDPHYQCRRPGLYQLFAQRLGHRPFRAQDCDAQQLIVHYGELAVLKTVDVSRVYRIDYLLAAEGQDIAARFGHSMFRLVICAPRHFSQATQSWVAATPYGPACLQDEAFHLVVSFRANVDDVKLHYWKGLVGGYVSRPFVLPYLQIVDEYTRDELRALTLYPLLLSGQQKTQLLNQMVEQYWTYQGDYRFINNNCGVESLHLMQAALPQHPVIHSWALSPRGVLQELEKQGLLNSRDPDRQTVQSQRAELEKLLRIAFVGKPAMDLQDYLQESTALQRRHYFAPLFEEAAEVTKSHISRVAAFRRLENYLLRQHNRRLNKAAKYELFEQQRDRLAGLYDLVNAVGVTTGGYGIPRVNEVRFNEQAFLDEVNRLKGEIKQWLIQHEPEQWRETELIQENLEQLDILALRQALKDT